MSPSEIAFNRSDSLTLNSDALVIFVVPNANDAAMLRIGISSIILGIISSGMFMPFKVEDFTNISPTFSLHSTLLF